MLNAGRAYYRLSADLIDRLIMRLFSSACVYCNLIEGPIELNRPISNPCILWEIGIQG